MVHTCFKPTRQSRRNGGTSHSLQETCSNIELLAQDNEAFINFTTQVSSESVHLSSSPLATRDESVLQRIFGKLHNYVVPEKKIKYRKPAEDDHDTKGTFWERMQAIISSDTSLLNCLLTKLAWGDESMSIPAGKEDAARAQMFVASECIRGAKEERNSNFRTLVTSAMSVLGYCGRLDFLKRLRLSYNVSTEKKNQKRRASSLRVRMKAMVLDVFCLPILCYDNLGFRNRQGFRKGLGYEQFTVLFIILISREQLTAINIYGPSALSRQRKNWEDIRATSIGTFEKVLKPSDEDCNEFASAVIDIYSSIMKAESEGIFPSLQKSRELLQTKAFRKGKIPETFICPQYRGRKMEETDEEISTRAEISAENIHYDNPMRQDLNKKSTVINLIKYLACIVTDMFADDNGVYDGDIPIMKDIPAPACGDGSPTSTAQSWLKRDGKPYAKLVTPVLGGFHLMLELFKKRGAIFEHTHLRNIFSMTRKSTKQQDFVLNPSDPNQCDAEGIAIHCGYFLSALRNLIDIKREKQCYHEVFKKDMKYGSEDMDALDDDDEDVDYFEEEELEEVSQLDAAEDIFDIDDVEANNLDMGSSHDENTIEDEVNASTDTTQHQSTSTTNNDDVSISVADVINFMVARAECNPQAFIILLDMRFAELIFLLHRAESQARTSLFCAAMRYAVLLYVNTNAMYYVEMICNFNVERACMSDAERAIHDNFILFRRTKNGKTIFTDRSVEWVMKDIRESLGKFFTDYTPAKLENFLLQLKDLKNLRGRDKQITTQPSKKAVIKLDSTFFEALVFCESANIWRGCPQAVQGKPYCERLGRDGVEATKDIGPPTQFYSTTGKVLYADVLSLVSRGFSRTKQYYERYFVLGDLEVTTRSQKDSDLKMVNITDDLLLKEIEFGLSFSVEQLSSKKGNIYNIARIEQELALLNDHLVDHGHEVIKPEKVKGRVSKFSWAAALVDARKEAKKLAVENVQDWEALQKESIIARFEGAKAKPLEIIEEELRNSFFNFASTAVKRSEIATSTMLFKYNCQGGQGDTFIQEANFVGSDLFYTMCHDSGYL